MLHYHGTPITPRAQLERMAGRMFCVPFPKPPTVEDLRQLRAEMGWSASQAAAAFWLGAGRRWREVEAGERRMDAARWTLGLLALGRHPTARLAEAGAG